MKIDYSINNQSWPVILNTAIPHNHIILHSKDWWRSLHIPEFAIHEEVQGADFLLVPVFSWKRTSFQIICMFIKVKQMPIGNFSSFSLGTKINQRLHFHRGVSIRIKKENFRFDSPLWCRKDPIGLHPGLVTFALICAPRVPIKVVKLWLYY